MRWSKQGLYRIAKHAAVDVETDPNLPKAIKEYILLGLSGIMDREAPVSIDGSGHLCYAGAGGGNYVNELTSAKLQVKPLQFVKEKS
jgi:hypothetical protein